MELAKARAVIEQSEKIVKYALEKGYGFAMWQLPRQKEKHIIIDFSGSALLQEDLEDLPSGFVFSPFDANNKEHSRFIRADIHIKSVHHKLSVTINPSRQYEADEFIQAASEADETPVWKWHYATIDESAMQKAHYINYVEKSVRAIELRVFDKVVAAREKRVSLNPHFDLFDLFNQLSSKYDNAFVSIVSLPESGTWVGATPEHLISISPEQEFYTTALAGTQAFDNNTQLCEAAWKQKDIEEQAFVRRYIVNCFKKIRLREYREIGPKTARAGNLIHLKTDFFVNLKEVNFPKLGSVMLELLHPTSATCGMPKDAASAFIKTEESMDRRYYSGFLGPVNIENDTEVFVNLRCMEIFKEHATLYAGAGITIDSNPEKEWLETEMKMNTLLDVINGLQAR